MIEVKPHLNLYQYTDDYKVWDINYDGNGNIQQLKRNGRATQNGLDMDNLVYNYGTGNLKNRLHSVSDAVTNSQYTTDIKNGQISNNYQYDESGRLVADLQAGAWYSYDSRGLVTAIYSNATRTIPLITYTYDERGNRSIKTNYDTNGNIVNQTWYVYDSGGNTLAIYERNNQTSTAQLYEQSIYGMSRLGLLRKQQQKYMYELTDHLGNIRAVLGKNESGDAELLSYADYYPFGMEMPGRTNITVSGANWRYGYQGLFAERDGLTGNNDFMLRQYDPRLGRWLTKDPMGQYASPYMAMGNNPVSYIDPTGGADYYIDGLWVSERTFSRLMGNPDFISNIDMMQSSDGLDYKSYRSNNKLQVKDGEIGYYGEDYGYIKARRDENGKLYAYEWGRAADWTGLISTNQWALDAGLDWFGNAAQWSWNNFLKDGALEGSFDGDLGGGIKWDKGKKLIGATLGIIFTAGTMVIYNGAATTFVYCLGTANIVNNIDNITGLSDNIENKNIIKGIQIYKTAIDATSVGIGIYGAKNLITIPSIVSDSYSTYEDFKSLKK